MQPLTYQAHLLNTMKTRQLITILILLAGFSLLREVEKKVSVQSKILLHEISVVFKNDPPKVKAIEALAILATYQK